MKKMILLVLVLCSVSFGSKITDIDFVNKIDRISGDTLTFARNSVALARDGTSVNADVLRIDYLPIASPVEYTATTKWPLACDEIYIYAIDVNGRTLYKSRNGLSWSAIYTFTSSPAAAWITQKGTLLISLNAAASNVGGKVYRYADNTMTEVIADTVLTDGATSPAWSWTEANGMVFISEYRSSFTTDNARCVYMSRDDGLTWAKIHNPDNVTGRHLHQIVAASENGITTVYACYGDTTAKAMFKITDNGTASWTATEVTQPYTAVQPTAGIWIPETQKILFGQDASAPAIFTLDTSGTFTPVHLLDINLSSLTNKTINVFKIKKIGGTYLAAISAQASQNNFYTGVYASLDGVKWVRVVNIIDTWLNIIGQAPDGKIWCAKSDGGFYFDLPHVCNLAGGLIERAAAQSMSVTVPTAGSGAVSAGTTAAEETGAGLQWDGSSCKWSSDATITTFKSLRFTSATLPSALVAGDTVAASLWIKGHIGDGYGNNKGYSASGSTGISEVKIWAFTHDKDTPGTPVDRKYGFLNPNDGLWQKVVVPITIVSGIDNGEARVTINIYVTGAADPADADFILYVDGVAVEKAISPSEYNPQATARLADVLSYDPTADFPAAFTDIFVVATRFGTYQMGAPSSGDGVSYIYLRSYAVDADNFFAVVYDVTDFKLKLINEVAGENTVIASSAACYLTMDEPVTLAVARTGETATLHIWTGGAYQTTTGTITDHTVALSYFGSHPSGTQGGSLVFVRDLMYDSVLSDTEIKAEMQWPEIFEYNITSTASWLSF